MPPESNARSPDLEFQVRRCTVVVKDREGPRRVHDGVVQVAHRSATTLNFETMARHLETLGEVSYNRFLLRFQAEGHEFTVFPDGRAIIKGTSDVDKARTLYAKYVGH